MLISIHLIGLQHARVVAHSDSKLFPWNNRLYNFPFKKRRSPVELFWMDTLCVPVNMGETLRRKAISQMNVIFAGADNVIVVDPEPQTISETSISTLQLRLRLACSPWMTRCWTFQEACLARAWHVYLHKGLYHPGAVYNREMDTLFRLRMAKSIWTDKDELKRESISFYSKMWPLIDQSPDYTPAFPFRSEIDDTNELTKIWSQLHERSTTRRKDRLVILAVLLDLNAGEIMGLDVQEQMRAILRTQKKIPMSLLFEPHSESVISSPKCSWIPLYPEGKISTAYGHMARNEANTRFQFTLSGIKALGFLIDATNAAHTQLRTNQTLPFNYGAWIKLVAREVPLKTTTRRASFIVLSRIKRISMDMLSPFVGARFWVESTTNDSKSYTLVYDCPITYTLTRPIDYSAASVDVSEPYTTTKPHVGDQPSEWDQRPELRITLLPEATQVLLDCGKR